MIQNTSILAYHTLPLGQRQQEVLAQFKIYGNMTGQECCDRMGLPINQVVGRIKELRDYGYLCRKGERMSKFKKLNMVWGINDNDPQERMF